MRISISVPKPCHEDWASMEPQAQGRHCAKCAHVVSDLTRASDAELVALFTSDERPKCARFDPAQLDRALSNRSESQSASLPIAAFTSLLAVAAGNEAIAQPSTAPRKLVGEVAITRPAPPPPAVMGKMMMPSPSSPRLHPVVADTSIRPDHQLVSGQARITGDTLISIVTDPPDHVRPPEHRVIVCGRLVEEGSAEPLAFATVQLQGQDDIRATTDPNGLFELVLPEGLRDADVALVVNAIGHEQRIIPLPAGGSARHLSWLRDRKPYRALRMINGRVIDEASNASIVDATVLLKGTAIAGATNEHGLFGFDPPDTAAAPFCVLVVSANGYRQMEFPLRSAAWPLAGTLKMVKVDPNVSEHREGSDEVRLGDLSLTPMKRGFLGMMVVTREPSTWQKVTRRLREMFH